jgi:hypothetical protein
MKIHAPLIITARLLPGARVGDGFISIEYSPRQPPSGRTRYRYFVDVGKRSYKGSDLQSGVGGGDLQEGFGSLLSFLSAAGEGYSYEQRTGRKSDNADMFPKWLNEWAADHEDELSMLSYEVEESKKKLIRE